MKRRLAAILAADLVGYSRIMGADEAGTLARLKALFGSLVRPTIQSHDGKIVKLMGDGLLAHFPSVVEAVQAALKIQETLLIDDEEVAEDLRLRLRVGIHLGDILIEGADIYGDGVNVAARLESLTPPGGLCISDSAYDQLDGKTSALFEDFGENSLKNIARPIRIWGWYKVRPAATQAPHPESDDLDGADQASLAVLPLNNMSDQSELEFLADGLTEDIITMLARLPGFLVIARNSTFAYKGQAPDIRQVGRELGVGYVVEGSLRPVGGNIRVTIQLIEAESGKHLWAAKFDQPTERIDELQDEITLGIATRLEPELAKAEIARLKKRGDMNVNAWGYYNQASGLLSLKGWHRETFEEATELLGKAISLDPDFALAHAYLSLIMALGHMFGLSPNSQGGKQSAIEKAEQAIEIDSYNPAVLGFAGCALSDVGEVARGIDILERAVEADPSNAQAWVALGTSYLRGGKAREGIKMLRHGMRISPLDNRLSFWGTNLAYALFRLRKLEEAEAEARQACRRDEKNYMGRVVLALILMAKGQSAQSQRELKDALRLRPDLRLEDLRSLVGRRGIQMLSEQGLIG